MQLSRRDALAAVGVAAGVGGAGVAADRATDGAVRAAVMGEKERESLPAETRRTLRAAAEVVYPSAAENVDEFVESYARGRLAADPDRRPGIVDAAAALADAGETFHDARFADLDPERRDATLRSLGVDTAEPDADGTLAERVRYYVVNDLLYAFYASPAGGEFVGTPNPIGYPGGYRTTLSPDNERADPDETSDPTAETRSATDSMGENDAAITSDDRASDDPTQPAWLDGGRDG